MTEETPSSRILVMYAYYETFGFKKNQTNLAYFIRYGLALKNTDYLFLINNYNCEVNIPSRSVHGGSVTVIKQKNCMDFEAYSLGIKYIEDIQGIKLKDKYDYIFFINCSVIGPTCEDDNWIQPYIDKCVGNVVCVSNLIKILGNTDLGGPGRRITSYVFLLKTTVLEQLLEEEVTNKCQGSMTYCKDIYKNTIFGPKRDKEDAVLTGEYGLSRVILSLGYDIDCLYSELKETDIFIKTLHFDRAFRGRLYLPRFYKQSIARLNINTEYFKSMFSINSDYYEHIGIKEKGSILTAPHRTWSSFKEYYVIFGKCEEVIVFPLSCRKWKAIYMINSNTDLFTEHILIAIQTLLYCDFEVTVSVPKDYSHIPIVKNLLPFDIVFREDLCGKQEDYDLYLSDDFLFPICTPDEFKQMITPLFLDCITMSVIIHSNLQFGKSIDSYKNVYSGQCYDFFKMPHYTKEETEMINKLFLIIQEVIIIDNDQDTQRIFRTFRKNNGIVSLQRMRDTLNSSWFNYLTRYY